VTVLSNAVSNILHHLSFVHNWPELCII